MNLKFLHQIRYAYRHFTVIKMIVIMLEMTSVVTIIMMIHIKLNHNHYCPFILEIIMIITMISIVILDILIL